MRKSVVGIETKNPRVVVSAEAFVTNHHSSKEAKILKARLDSAPFDGSKISRWTDVPGMVWEVGTGVMAPIPIAPTDTIRVKVQFELTLDSDGKGGWVEPKTVEGTVVLVDQFESRHESPRFLWS